MQKELRRVGKEKGESSVNLGAVWWWLGVIIFYVCVSYIHSTTVNPFGEADYVVYGSYVAYATAPYVLRKFLVFPKSPVMMGYCALYDTVMFPVIRNHLLLILCVLFGFWRSYWFTFALLDILNMSVTLEKVILSVTIPFNQLMQTFALFIIVICCYTAVAFEMFGSVKFVDGDDDDAENACNSLIDCFVFSL